MTLQSTFAPPVLPQSKLGFRIPQKRASELDGMTSVKVQELFPDIPAAIWNFGQDIDPVELATKQALENVDFDAIKEKDTVNILCSEHGFALMGGAAYAQVLKTIKDVLELRTGCKRIKLGFAAGLSKIEAAEILPQHGLDSYFESTFAFGPYDRGVAIDTEIGTLYGIGAAYKAKHIIHVHYDDPREVHFHRANGRTLKAFAMSYARFETRGVFHNNFPTESAMVVPRLIYESDFVQSKFRAAVVLTTSPDGVTGVDADNDLIQLDRRVSANQIKNYGKLLHLFDAVDECIVVLDSNRWAWYCHAGGITSCNLMFGPADYLDLEYKSKVPNNAEGAVSNPAVKAFVINYMWKQAYTTPGVPTISTQPSITRLFQGRGVQKPFYDADGLEAAMDKAYEITGTDKVIIFDGAFGAINCSPAMANYFREVAPQVNDDVEENYLKKWLGQRGLD